MGDRCHAQVVLELLCSRCGLFSSVSTSSVSMLTVGFLRALAASVFQNIFLNYGWLLPLIGVRLPLAAPPWVRGLSSKAPNSPTSRWVCFKLYFSGMDPTFPDWSCVHLGTPSVLGPVSPQGRFVGTDRVSKK